MDEHSLQSPFLFETYQKALNPTLRKKVSNYQIEALREKCCHDNRSIKINNFGSGSSMPATRSSLIKTIARFGISGRRQSEVLVNLIESYQCENILELGTSLGLNTIYLSQAQGLDRVVTVDGSAELMEMASDHFAQLNCQNIDHVVSDIDKFLNESRQSFDFIYIDANHTLEATLRYFKRSLELISAQGIIVIDDINWSQGMSKAWSSIIRDYANNLYLENDKIGIVFANVRLQKRHYILRF